MDNCLIIVDNSNVFIEGQKHSAKRKGVIKTNPEDRDVCDPSWRIDFGQLLIKIAEGKNIIDAVLVGSRPPQNDSVWSSAKNEGLRVITHDRDSFGKEKAVDTELVAQGTEIICTQAQPGILKLLSGDRDFIPLINIASKRGWETEMWAFTNSYNISGQMAQAVDRVKPLDDIFSEIGSYQFEWSGDFHS